MSSEAWELVDADLQISRLVVHPTTDGSQQVHLDARSIQAMSRWYRLVSVARHYYRLRRLMGIIGWCLRENKQDATDELLEQFPEIDPKRAAKLAKEKEKARKAKAKAKQASVVPKSRGSSSRSSWQPAVVQSSVPDGVPDEIVSRASIKNSHYE